MVKGPKPAPFGMGHKNSKQVTRKTADFHLLVPLNQGRNAYVHNRFLVSCCHLTKPPMNPPNRDGQVQASSAQVSAMRVHAPGCTVSGAGGRTASRPQFAHV